MGMRMTASNDAGWNRILGLVAWLVTVALAAGLATVASIDASGLYGQLVKPDWAPPASLFGPAWTVLYLLMALAAYPFSRKFGWCEAIYQLPDATEALRSHLPLGMDSIAIVKAGYRLLGYALTERGRKALGQA